MADKKITELADLDTSTADDVIAIVDLTGPETKKQTKQNFLKEIVATVVPSGVIVMWSGAVADIPAGWFFCDGDNGTPDLRDRFIVGAKQDDGGVAKTNLTGALTKSGNSNVAAHVHADTYGYASGPAVADGVSGVPHRSVTTKDSGSYGSGTETYPKYYALAYIMKA